MRRLESESVTKDFQQQLLPDCTTRSSVWLHLGESQYPREVGNQLLLSSSNIILAGSNPNQEVVNGTEFHTFVVVLSDLYSYQFLKSHSEFRVEYLNPPFMSVPRPQLSNVPASIQYNQHFKIAVSIPNDLKAASVQGTYLIPVAT